MNPLLSLLHINEELYKTLTLCLIPLHRPTTLLKQFTVCLKQTIVAQKQEIQTKY